MKKTAGFEDGVYYWQVPDAVYGVRYWVLISQSHSVNPCDKLIFKHRPTYNYDPDHEAIASCIEHTGVHGAEIFLTFRKVASASSRAHEATHAKNFVFKRAGVVPDVDNDEHEAYYMGFIANIIESAFEDMNQAIKKKRKTKNNGGV